MTTVTAALAWYDEPIDELTACVEGLTGVADRLIALDGAYRRYPGGRAHSPAEQVRAINRAAEASGIACLVLQPGRLWAGQVEKRTYLMNVATVDTDWIAVVDSDHVVIANGADVHAELAGFTEPVVDIKYHYPSHPERGLEESAATVWAQGLAGEAVSTPHFYRAMPGMRYEGYHYRFSGIWNGQRVWLDNSQPADHTYPHTTHHQGLAGYRVEHRCLLRTPEKIRGNRAFCNDRVMVVAQTNQEDDRPDLPRPIFDFEARLV